MPCVEVFDRQVGRLPGGCSWRRGLPVFTVEAGSTFGWDRFTARRWHLDRHRPVRRIGAVVRARRDNSDSHRRQVVDAVVTAINERLIGQGVLNDRNHPWFASRGADLLIVPVMADRVPVDGDPLTPDLDAITQGSSMPRISQARLARRSSSRRRMPMPLRRFSSGLARR